MSACVQPHPALSCAATPVRTKMPAAHSRACRFRAEMHRCTTYMPKSKGSCLHAHPLCMSSPDPMIWPRHMNISKGSPRTYDI